MAVVEEELPAIKAYAARHGWGVEWAPDALRLAFLGKHPEDATPIQLIAAVDGFKALPPAWTFAKPGDTPASGVFFPRADRSPLDNVSSIFLQDKNVICAPFNRLAYQEHGGPHNDWQGPSSWLAQKGKGYAFAEKLADMFAIVLAHLQVSGGMKQ